MYVRDALSILSPKEGITGYTVRLTNRFAMTLTTNEPHDANSLVRNVKMRVSRIEGGPNDVNQPGIDKRDTNS
jgi:hypothetical protein